MILYMILYRGGRKINAKNLYLTCLKIEGVIMNVKNDERNYYEELGILYEFTIQ